ncbi:cell wall assembly protein [Pseudomonas taeanensis MS-3]|uniref:Cell wall assembly protein n=1 Tax=Pseudomonas taeanensis MS-3 TaxID=1395571 RepID=A0A0A1YPF7_9PSED|nr:SMI1/KNR4 family protein [Pseudomonas taeanensis]KFX70946.1 cell wall assembly protein [Pseudomonas taeanensis MS-3]
MEEVIEQLREMNEPVPVPLELPDEETLVEIQEQILIHLPYGLREFLLQVSDVVYGRLEPVTAADPQSHTYLPEVASMAWSLGVPRELVPICEDRGNYYCVEEDGTVLLWEGETGELNEDETWESVWHWVRDIWLES